jgi:single-stranded-DNA-specific exonuclease
MVAPTLTTEKIWSIQPHDEDIAQMFEQELLIPPIVARILTQRGILDLETAERFLNPKLESLSSPFDLPDFEAARRVLMDAREKNERIYIHGDYDVDGVTSAAILFRFLSKTGFDVIGHVPHRETEGYGIHIDTIRRAHAEGANVILTCDCGTGAHEQIKAAYELGMRVVVTDHHESPEVLPPAEAIVNPKRRDYHGEGTEMSGAGIAFLLCAGLCEDLGIKREVYTRHFLDLAVMGTVADVMPLRDNNRIIARHGLPALKGSLKKGVQALLRVSNLDDARGKLTTRHIGFQLGPRINAVGRIDDADVAFKLLITEDSQEAQILAEFLDKKNQERRNLQDQMVIEAAERILADGLDQNSAIVIASEGWQKGIVGIVAGKVVEQFRRPAFILGIHGDIASGSARSIPAFNLFEAIEANRDLLIKGGGHAAAAGVSLAVENVNAFATAINQYAAKRLTPEDFLPRIRIDQEIGLNQANLDLVRAIGLLEPFGESNPEPVFLIKDVAMATCSPTRNPIHARLSLAQDGQSRTAMAFGIGEALAELPLQTKMDVVCTAEEDTFNGRGTFKLLVKDVRTG